MERKGGRVGWQAAEEAARQSGAAGQATGKIRFLERRFLEHSTISIDYGICKFLALERGGAFERLREAERG